MRVLVFQHVAGEPPAAFSDHFAAHGDTAHIVRFFEDSPIPDLEGFDALIVMGGPMDVWETDAHPWLIAEKVAIRRWVGDLARPYLGICLGHQLLADALGGHCEKLLKPAISVSNVSRTATSDALFDPLPATFPVLKWHGVEVTTLPPDSVTLASAPDCRHQVIRVGHKAWGVQFHPEITPGLVSGWLTDPGNMAVATDWLGSARAAMEFARDCENHCAAAAPQSAALYDGLRRAASVVE